jgi:hypothetical protein
MFVRWRCLRIQCETPMKNKPWKEPQFSGDIELAPWNCADNAESREIQPEPLRYCPEFPFNPAPQEPFKKDSVSTKIIGSCVSLLLLATSHLLPARYSRVPCTR